MQSNNTPIQSLLSVSVMKWSNVPELFPIDIYGKKNEMTKTKKQPNPNDQQINAKKKNNYHENKHQ